MVTKDLSEAAVEFKSILENCSDDIVNKIPTNFLKFIDKIASKTYKFNYDKTKSLIEQNLKQIPAASDEERFFVRVINCSAELEGAFA